MLGWNRWSSLAWWVWGVTAEVKLRNELDLDFWYDLGFADLGFAV